MKKLTMTAAAALIALSVAACTTPMTVLKNPKTGNTVQCGGDATASMAGGVIGYHIQKDNDKRCVTIYQNNGYKIIETDIKK